MILRPFRIHPKSNAFRLYRCYTTLHILSVREILRVPWGPVKTLFWTPLDILRPSTGPPEIAGSTVLCQPIFFRPRTPVFWFLHTSLTFQLAHATSSTLHVTFMKLLAHVAHIENAKIWPHFSSLCFRPLFALPDDCSSSHKIVLPHHNTSWSYRKQVYLRSSSFNESRFNESSRYTKIAKLAPHTILRHNWVHQFLNIMWVPHNI